MKSNNLDIIRKYIDREMVISIGPYGSPHLAQSSDTVTNVLKLIDELEGTDLFNLSSAEYQTLSEHYEVALYKFIGKNHSCRIFRYEDIAYCEWIGTLYAIRQIEDFKLYNEFLILETHL